MTRSRRCSSKTTRRNRRAPGRPLLPLSVGATFWYGALGAIAAFIIVQVLPWGYALLNGADLHISPRNVLGAVLIVGAFIVGGGFIAVIIGDATLARHALAYGFAWQSLVGAFLKPQAVPAPN